MGIKKAIVVEDNMLISVLYRHYLEKLNYEVIAEIKNGIEAVSVIKEKAADLIIMDIMLEGDMCGIEVVEEIRKTIDTPVVFATGNSDEMSRNRALSFKCTEFLVKPVAIETFTKAIKKVEKLHKVA